MLKVGLTGGIASGKSTVSDILRSHGLTIIDADIISRQVLDIYPEIKENIKRKFGEHFFDNNGKLLRRELGNFIFKYPEERKILEEMMIPYITKEIFKRIDEYNRAGVEICVLDAPTLIEHGLNKDMNFNILVSVDKCTQVSRLRYRDGLSYDQIMERINSQMPIEKKRECVDFIIDNNSDLSYTKSQVDNIVKILLDYCSEKY